MHRASTADLLDTLLVVMILAVLFVWFVHTFKDELWTAIVGAIRPVKQSDLTAGVGHSPNRMTPSQLCLDLVKHFEGLYLKTYLCPARIFTIGYGHTGLMHNDGTVFPGRKITESEAEALLRYDLEKFSGKVARLVKVPLEQHQFDALVSFAFNVGEGALSRSSLLKKLNAHNYAGAAEEFAKWNKGGGKVLSGLTRRRKAERHLFATGELHFFA